jgi:hypothetical protein
MVSERTKLIKHGIMRCHLCTKSFELDIFGIIYGQSVVDNAWQQVMFSIQGITNLGIQMACSILKFDTKRCVPQVGKVIWLYIGCKPEALVPLWMVHSGMQGHAKGLGL